MPSKAFHDGNRPGTISVKIGFDKGFTGTGKFGFDCIAGHLVWKFIGWCRVKFKQHFLFNYVAFNRNNTLIKIFNLNPSRENFHLVGWRH